MRVALASREVYPLGGGGIGQFVTAAAHLLSSVAEVTVFTTSLFEELYERLRAEGDPRLPPRVVFVPEPSLEEAAAWNHLMHLYSASLLDRLREVYPDGGPELIEFPDFLGEGFVTLQAAETLDPFLERTRVCVRIHTTGEICDVLDGYQRPDFQTKALHAMERFTLAHADRVIWQGGDILGTYERFYGSAALAPAVRIRYPYRGPSADAGADASFTPSAPLRILYAGRLERRKGVHNLVRAATGLASDAFRLTLLGGDTYTGPLGVSVREQLELAAAGDERIVFSEPLPREAVGAAISEHDVIAVPSLWECWPYAALEAMHQNRPVLGTPVGGMTELVEPGITGWLASGTGSVALERALEALLAEPAELAAMVRGERPRERALRLSDDREILDAYESLVLAPPRRMPRRRSTSRLPLVSAVVPYYRASRWVLDTIDSLAEQTYPRLEIVLVNDGSFEEEDWILGEISARHRVVVVSQVNAGLGAARNFGVLQSRGRYVFPLDADNVAAPGFVARCVEVLEAREDIAYATSWSRYIDEAGAPRAGPDWGYEPLGNHAALNAEWNVAGDAAALVRRRIFDAGFRYSEELTSLEDWHFYRELQRAGHFGAVIPERLLNYRVRADSLQATIVAPRRARLIGEIEALMRENEMRWTS